MAPWTGLPWVKKEKPKLSVQDGLYQIGSQAYHILLRDFQQPSTSQPTADKSVVVLIPSEKPQHNRNATFERTISLRNDEYDDWDSRFMLRTDFDDFGDKYNEMWGQRGWFKPSCVPISIILILIVLVVILPLLDSSDKQKVSFPVFNASCQEMCSLSLLETIPKHIFFPNNSYTHFDTFEALKYLIHSANHTIEIASHHIALQNGLDSSTSDFNLGAQVYNMLIEASKRNVNIKIAQSQPTGLYPGVDSDLLAKKASAQIRNINMPRLVGGGEMNTKLWIVDRSLAYIGSADMDWRSFSQFKELGVLIKNCSCVVNDMAKIFDMYWEVAGTTAMIPAEWPESILTGFNIVSPINEFVNGEHASIYITSSPEELCAKNRTSDIDGIVNLIKTADKYLYISVMDYAPVTIFSPKPLFWPPIENALKAAMIENKIKIKLLVSWWNGTYNAKTYFVKSLLQLNNAFSGVEILVKLFAVNNSFGNYSDNSYIKINHNKFMVTDNSAYIGGSDWTGDSFTTTSGIGLAVIGNTSFRQVLEDVFLRDWNSEYAFSIIV